jgi:IS30 family transposase
MARSFSNPHAIEYDAEGRFRTRLFYCDAASPYQKGALERGHEYIRMVFAQRIQF